MDYRDNPQHPVPHHINWTGFSPPKWSNFTPPLTDERRKFPAASKPQGQNLISQQTDGINTGLRPVRLGTRQLNGEYLRQGAGSTRKLGTVPLANCPLLLRD